MKPVSTGGSLIGRIGSYLQIVSKDPSSTAFVPLAEAYRQIGLLDDALEAARLGTKMLPHFSPGFSSMGRILGQMGRLDEAMGAYASALSIDRQSQSALVGLARLHLIRGERDQARKILKQAQEFHPEDEKICDMLIALDLPRPWAEIKQAPQLKEIDEPEVDSPEVNAEPIPTATLAEIYVKQGLFEQAIKIYQDILKLNPENNAACERLFQLQKQSGSVPTPSTVKSGSTEKAVTAEVVAKVVVASAPSEAPSILREESQDRSPLAVFQRWLTIIKQGKVNV